MTKAVSSNRVMKNPKTMMAVNEVLKRERDEILAGTVHTEDFVPIRDLTHRQNVELANVRYELVRAKQKIDMLRQELDETRATMRSWYGELRGKSDEDTPKYSLKYIADWCCKVHGIPMEVVLGNRRDKRIVLCRQQFFRLAREYTGISFPAIGHFCSKDHTTVIHGARTYLKNKRKFRREDKRPYDPQWWKTQRRR